MSPEIRVGSLVQVNAHTEFFVLGIVTEIRKPFDHQLWYDQNIVTVLCTDTGESTNWAGSTLELIA